MNLPPDPDSFPTPPRWASWLLEQFCAPHLLEEMRGDLEELYQQRVATLGVQKANYRYVKDVLSLVRPFIIRPKKTFLPQPASIDMLTNYFTIAWRNIAKYKFHSSVNILGLTVGIAFTLLIGAFIWSEYQVNAHLQDSKRQYIIQSRWRNPDQGLTLTTLGALPRALREAYPQLVSNYYRFDGITVIASYQDKVFEENASLGDTTLLAMYGFELLAGDRTTAFGDPYNVVITESMAQKYFGQTNAVNHPLTIRNFNGEKRDFLVSAVIKIPPVNSVTSLNEANHNQLFLSGEAASFFGRAIDAWDNPYIGCN